MSDAVQGVGSIICIVYFILDASVGLKSVRHARPGITNPNTGDVDDIMLMCHMLLTLTITNKCRFFFMHNFRFRDDEDSQFPYVLCHVSISVDEKR